MTFSLTILGSNSAIPANDRNLSAHLLEADGRFFLIDCGEGTQFQLRKCHLSYQRIKHIFISHLHGDHFFGLIGLLNSMHLLGRNEVLHLYANSLLQEILQIQLDASQTRLVFPVVFHPLNTDRYDLILDEPKLTVHSFPLCHSIPACGFVFREKKQPLKIRKEVINRLHIPITERDRIKNGADYTDDSGRFYPNVELTLDSPRARSYAYCSDTIYHEPVIPWIRGVDILYHEATFMEELASAAADKFHATAMQAATIASKAQVKKLILGHFSARYENLQPLLNEARTIFPETYLAVEREKILIG